MGVDIVARGMAANAGTKVDETAQKIDAFTQGFSFKGEVDYYSDLPNDAEVGDLYIVKYQGSSGTEPDGNQYAWGESGGTETWIPITEEIYTRVGDLETDVEGLQTTVYGGSAETTEAKNFISRDCADSSGNITTGATYWSTGLINVSGITKIAYKGKVYARYAINFYDSDSVWLGGALGGTSGTYEYTSLQTVTEIPEGTAKILVQTRNNPPTENDYCSITYETQNEGLVETISGIQSDLSGLSDNVSSLSDDIDDVEGTVNVLTVGGSAEYPFYISGLRNVNGDVSGVPYYKGISVLVDASFTNRFAHSSWIYVKGISEVSVPEGFKVGNSNGTGAYAFDENYNLVDNGATVTNNKITISDGVYWLRYVIHDDEDSGGNPIPLTTSQSFSETGGVEMDGTTATTGYYSTGMISIPEGTREIVYKGSVYNCYGVNFYDANDQFISGEFIAVTNPSGTPTVFTYKKSAAIPQGAVKVLAQTIDGTEESASFEFADKIGNVSITVTGADVATNRDDTNRSFIEVNPPIDPDWDKWQNERYSWFYKTNSDPIFAECYAPFEANMISVRGGKGRYGTDPEKITHTPSPSAFVDGGHLFEGWNADETLRLTMLIGKYDYKMACIQCYGTPALNDGERIYGYIKIGSDFLNEGVNFGAKSAKFFVPLLLNTANANPTTVTEMYEVNDGTTVPDGAIYYNTNDNAIRIKANGAWYAISTTVQNGRYPTKSVTTASVTIAPNVDYDLGTRSSATITLGAEVNDGYSNEYCFKFQTDSTTPTINFTDAILWANGNTPTFEANKKYQISIKDGIGCFVSADVLTQAVEE